MTINFSDFFTKAGKAFHAGNTVATAVGTTVRDEVEDFVQQFGSATIEVEQVTDGILSQLEAFYSSGQALISSAVVSPIQELLVEVVAADNPQPVKDVTNALAELIRQMEAGSQSLDASAIGTTVSYGGSNTGTGVVIASTKRGDGRVNEHILAEDLEAIVTSVSSDGSAIMQIDGEEPVSLTAHNWPAGSGASFSLSSIVAGSAANLVTTGDFETAETLESELPDGWIASIATLGTTLKLTDVEVQTVIISGTPTGGYYTLSWNNQTTDPIAYNAAQSTVQTALRGIVGLENVTVATTGTSPNYTHTITFTGVTNPAQLTSSAAKLTGGTPAIAHATTTAASANVLRGSRALEFDSNGSELTTIQTRVSLAAATPYAFCAWMLADVVPVAGEMTIDLVDGIGGSVIADDQSSNNSLVIDATALTTSFVAKTAVFRTPSVMPDVVYLRIRISTTAISAGTSVFVDEVTLQAMTEAYTGGLYLAAVSGGTDWELNDTAKVAVTNDRAGALHEWMNRVFGLRESDLLLPTDSGGSETIADSLIA